MVRANTVFLPIFEHPFSITSSQFFFWTGLYNDFFFHHYAVWCRRTDELVDGPNAPHITPAALNRWEQRLEDIFKGRPYDMLDAALADAVAKFPVDIQVSLWSMLLVDIMWIRVHLCNTLICVCVCARVSSYFWRREGGKGGCAIAWTCVYVHRHVHVHEHMDTHACAWACAHGHGHVHVHIYIYVYINSFICIL